MKTFFYSQSLIWLLTEPINCAYVLLQSTTFLLTGGSEKILRIFDLARPDATATEIEGSPGVIRTAVWLHSDQSLLSSCSDTGGVRYMLLNALFFP